MDGLHLLALSGAYFIDHSAGWLHWQITAPAILFIAGIFGISFRLSSGKVNDDNPNKFVQGMMLGTTLKFLVFIAAAALYLFIQRKICTSPICFMSWACISFFNQRDLFLISGGPTETRIGIW
ncbi:MAG: hypothetical protein HWD58_18365 [Bacteroidota bacterium]|nr:MAG: hypothetical protein HWD58_18365 [Bacteroidota bacterium]